MDVDVISEMEKKFGSPLLCYDNENDGYISLYRKYARLTKYVDYKCNFDRNGLCKNSDENTPMCCCNRCN